MADEFTFGLYGQLHGNSTDTRTFVSRTQVAEPVVA